MSVMGSSELFVLSYITAVGFLIPLLDLVMKNRVGRHGPDSS